MRWVRQHALTIWFLVFCAICLAGFARMEQLADEAHVASDKAKAAVIDQAQAREERLRQLCEVFGGFYEEKIDSYVTAADQYQDTLRYLRALRPDEQHDTINVFIRSNLPRTRQERRSAWQEAKAAQPPAFCEGRDVTVTPLPERPR